MQTPVRILRVPVRVPPLAKLARMVFHGIPRATGMPFCSARAGNVAVEFGIAARS